MKNEISLQEIAKTIGIYGYVTQQIENSKLNKTLLIAVKKGSKSNVLVFEEENGLNEIGSATFTINGRGVYLSKFVVNENFQQNGIGRLMFNLAMACGDKMGRTCIYGEANPTDPIKGVSNQENNTFLKEQEKIRELYECLGCQLNGENFVRNWQSGKILKQSDKQVISLVNKIFEIQPENQ